jgi:hypothetical protein
MKKLKLGLVAIAFVFAAGAAVAHGTIQPGWYQPNLATDVDGQPVMSKPAECNGDFELCATRYNDQGDAVEQAFIN